LEQTVTLPSGITPPERKNYFLFFINDCKSDIFFTGVSRKCDFDALAWSFFTHF